eukprot:COSAG01_NODE_679_length_14296_cov_250.437575_17_plen_205_part_00
MRITLATARVALVCCRRCHCQRTCSRAFFVLARSYYYSRPFSSQLVTPVLYGCHKPPAIAGCWGWCGSRQDIAAHYPVTSTRFLQVKSTGAQLYGVEIRERELGCCVTARVDAASSTFMNVFMIASISTSCMAAGSSQQEGFAAARGAAGADRADPPPPRPRRGSRAQTQPILPGAPKAWFANGSTRRPAAERCQETRPTAPAY